MTDSIAFIIQIEPNINHDKLLKKNSEISIRICPDFLVFHVLSFSFIITAYATQKVY